MVTIGQLERWIRRRFLVVLTSPYGFDNILKLPSLIILEHTKIVNDIAVLTTFGEVAFDLSHKDLG